MAKGLLLRASRRKASAKNLPFQDCGIELTGCELYVNLYVRNKSSKRFDGRFELLCYVGELLSQETFVFVFEDLFAGFGVEDAFGERGVGAEFEGDSDIACDGDGVAAAGVGSGLAVPVGF